MEKKHRWGKGVVHKFKKALHSNDNPPSKSINSVPSVALSSEKITLEIVSERAQNNDSRPASVGTSSPPPAYERADPSTQGIVSWPTETVSTEVVETLHVSAVPSPEQTAEQADFTEEDDPYGDTRRTKTRYRNALGRLEDALERAQGNWKSFPSSELDVIQEGGDPSQLRVTISNVLKSYETSVKSTTRWAKCKRVIEVIYTALSPFVKNLVVVILNSQAVDPLLRIRIDFAVESIADREVGRREEIENTLDYISRQLGQLQITETLPTANVPSQALINSAMDVRSAVMRYLAVQIHHQSNALGVTGRIISTLTTGDEDYVAVNQEVEAAVTNFNSSLSHYGHGVGFKTFEYVEGIRRDFDRLLVSQSLHTTAMPAVAEKFLVPYDENPHFVGRERLLKDLRKKLLEVVPQKYNHRVALYGLGGVGKTQTALAYVYAHKLDYDAIYWITGVNQASLLSGYQDIAKIAGLVKWTADISPSDIAKNVLSWLRGQENWLLVIDNVDDISAVDGYLPDRAVGKHTLITTRNTNYYEIPAEGMEIGILDSNDAERLLLLRSKYSTRADPERVQTEAAEIVNKLGYLALAIEQAAAYIRETSKDIFRFLPSYQADRKKHHARIPRGNWEYSKAVATTWHLSFQQVEQNNGDASELLRLISFLNPDGILVEFLEVGKDGLPGALRDLVEDTDLLYEALSELERFSLIRREDENGEVRITIHRLVQCVIKDEMNEEQYSAMTQAAIDLCDRAFPEHWEEEMRMLCRRYQEQVIVTLSDIKGTKSSDLLRVLTRVAAFLHDDGKYTQAAELRQKVIALSTTLNGPEHPDTVKAMGQLAETYRSHRRWPDALVLHEKVVEIAKKIWGDESLDTWAAVGDLAATYRSVGRRLEAAQLQEKVLEVRMKALGEDHPETIRAMGNLGATYRNQRRLNDAVKLQERVLEQRAKTLGDNHPDTLSAMTNIAVTYRYGGERDRAALLEEKVVEVRTASLGLEHPFTLDAIANLAATYGSQKRWDDALQLQEKVRSAREKVMGEEHPDTMWAMANLAETYRHKGRFEEAVVMQERVLEMRRRLFGDMHQDTLAAMRKLAETFSQQKRWGDAARLQGEIVEVREKLGAVKK